MDEELTARQRFLECVLILKSEFERAKFNDFVIANYNRYNIDSFRNRMPYFPDSEDYSVKELPNAPPNRHNNKTLQVSFFCRA